MGFLLSINLKMAASNIHWSVVKLRYLGSTISYRGICEQIEIPRYEKLPNPPISDVIIMSCRLFIYAVQYFSIVKYVVLYLVPYKMTIQRKIHADISYLG